MTNNEKDGTNYFNAEDREFTKQLFNCNGKTIKGTWAYEFWTDTFDKLEKNYNSIKNKEGINDNKF